MSALARADLVRAKRLVQVVEEGGPVHEDDLVVLLGCDRAELRAATGIAYHWRRVNRCGDFLVAVPPRERGRAA